LDLERSIRLVAECCLIAIALIFLGIHPKHMGNNYHHHNIHLGPAFGVLAHPVV